MTKMRSPRVWNRMLADPEAADPELDAFVAEATRLVLKNSEW
jgi:hypothetical protein